MQTAFDLVVVAELEEPAGDHVPFACDVVHVHRNDYDAAEAVFREVLRGDGRFHRAWHNLGVVLGAKGDRAGAAAAFRRAAELSPQDASTIYNLAILERDRRSDPMAERRAFERAVALDPDLAEAHLSLGTLLCDPGTPAAVRDEIDAEDRGLAAHDRHQAGDRSQDRRLACAVRATQQHDLAALDVQVEPCERREAAEEADDGAESDEGHASLRGPRAGRDQRWSSVRTGP